MNHHAEALSRRLEAFEISERQTREAIQVRQRAELVQLVGHCAAYSSYFHDRLAAAGLKPDDFARPDALEKLPILSRRELQGARDIFCTAVPAPDLPCYENRTSGSTGEPVIVWRTTRNQGDWLAATMREHVWHKRDFSGAFCSIRANIAKEVRHDNWGVPAALLHRTGPLLGLPITLSIETQAALIREFRTSTLLIYPSDLAGLVRHCEESGTGFPDLKEILTIGETLSQHVRADVETLFGAKLADMYSSQEAGVIALQCPQSGLYHVMAENLIVEVVDSSGRHVRSGETGRVLITDLHNYATPLIRYDIGDYAQVGPLCPCGRGLPTLVRLLGRERNLILMPDGSRHFPLVGFREFRDIAPIVQYQAIQHDRERIEMRLVVERPLTAAEESAFVAHVQSALGYPFALDLSYFEGRIPTGANGKFEEFLCCAV